MTILKVITDVLKMLLGTFLKENKKHRDLPIGIMNKDKNGKGRDQRSQGGKEAHNDTD